jgi:hypothetical protein
MNSATLPFEGDQYLRPFGVFDVTVADPVAIDDAGHPGRRFVPITGGVVSGALEGRVLPGGGDWQWVWPDRLELSAHYILETTDGALIEVRSNGVRQAAPDVLSRLARGEDVDPATYYFRTAVRFATGASHLKHLNHLLCVAMAARRAKGVFLRVFEVL